MATEFARSATNPIFIPLASATNISGVVWSTANALGVDAREWADVVSELGQREFDVVVFDNVEQVIDDFAHAAGTLPAGPLYVTTSREPLRIRGEKIIRVQPLDREDATALCEARVRELGVELPTDEVALLVDNLDGLPLAIELAAGRMPSSSAADFLEALHDDIGSGGQRRRDAEPRHRTLQAAIRWSWDLLDDRERRVMRRIAWLVAPFGSTVACAICGETEGVSEVLADLVDRSLLQRDATTNRFTVLVSVQLFAREMCEDVSAELTAIAEGIHHTLDQVDLENARAILIAAADHEVSVEVTSALAVGLARQMLRRVRVEVAVEILNRFVSDDATVAVRADRWAAQTHALQQMHRHPEAIDAGRRAVQLADEVGDPGLGVGARFNLAGSLGRMDEAQEALSILDEAQELADRAGPAERGAVMGNRALILLSTGDLDGADALFEQLVVQARNHQNLIQEALTLMHQGIIERDRMHVASDTFDEPLAIFAHAASVAKQANNDRIYELCERFRAYVLADAGRRDEAVATLQPLLAHTDAIGEESRSASLEQNIAHIVADAHDRIERSEAVLARARQPLFRLEVLLFLSGEYLATHDFDLLRARAREGVSIAPSERIAAVFAGYMAVGAALEAKQTDALLERARSCDAFALFEGAVAAARGESWEVDDQTRAHHGAYHRVHLGYGRPNPLPPLERALRAATAPTAAVALSRDAREVILGGERLDFSRRTTLRRILLALAQNRAGLGVEDIIAAAWPGEKMTHQSGLDRVYSAVRTLRKLGLGDGLETDDGVYRLAPRLRIDWLD